MKKIIVLLSVLLISQSVNGVTKKFVSTLDLTNSRNWLNKNIPCAGKTAVFNLQASLQVYHSGSMSFKSMQFQSDVQLLFGEESSFLVLSENEDSSCTLSAKDNPESVFSAHSKGYWWDPDSWECHEEDSYECNSAVPDINRVPCLRDTALLPNVTESLYKMVFTGQTPSISYLKIGNKNLSTSEFYTLVMNETHRFIREESTQEEHRSFLYVEGENSCSDVTGCTCHVAFPKEEICKRKSIKCPANSCSDPVEMAGFCCPQCGVDLSISHNGTLSLWWVKKLLKQVQSQLPSNQKVDTFVSKMPDGFLHVYFMPFTEGNDLKPALNTFFELFDRDVNRLGIYTMSSVKAEGFSSKNQGSLEPKTKVWIFVIVFIIVASLALSFLIYKKQKLRIFQLVRSDLFSFRRLSINSGRLSMSSRRTSIPSSAHITAVPTAEGRSFTNPTFMKGTETFQINTGDVQDVVNSSIILDESSQNQRENPLYKIHEKSGAGITFSDLQQTSEELEIDLVDDKIEPTNFLQEESIIIIDEPEIMEVSPETLSDDGVDQIEILARSRIEEAINMERDRSEEIPVEDTEPALRNNKLDDDEGMQKN